MHTFKRILLATCAFGAAVPAFAQDAAQAGAQDAASSGGLEEIIVTARKREESVQTVPVAVTAISEKTIQQRDITSIEKIAAATPNLTGAGNDTLNGLAKAGANVLTGGAGQIVDGDQLMAVIAEKVPPNNLAEFIATAKASPGRMTYSSGGNGSAGHLAGEMFKNQAKVFAVHIPYNGGNPAQLALLAGQVDFNIDNLATAAANIRAGKLRALAVTTAQRSSVLPEVPALAETLPGFEIDTWWGLVAPAGTPPAVIARLDGLGLQGNADRHPGGASSRDRSCYGRRSCSASQPGTQPDDPCRGPD